MFGNRGIWRTVVSMDKNYLKVNYYKTSEGIRPIMSERHHNVFEFYENELDLEKKIFLHIDKPLTENVLF